MKCLICGYHLAERGHVCEADRANLATNLGEVPDLLVEALTLTIAPDVRAARRLVGAHLGAANLVEVPAEPISALLPSGPTGSPGRVRVTGTRSAPLPVSVELLNLVGPGTAAVTDEYGDQIGELPPPAWLGEWVAHWAKARGERRPVPTIPRLVGWLGVRLDWACGDESSAIAAFATELDTQCGILRNLAGVVIPGPEPCEGIACPNPKCDMRALYRVHGSHMIHCGACPRLLTAEEYQAEVKRQAQLARAS